MDMATARVVTIATVAVALALNPYGALVDLAVIGGVVMVLDTAKPVIRKLKQWRNHRPPKRRFKTA